VDAALAVRTQSRTPIVFAEPSASGKVRLFMDGIERCIPD
jgi:hypothetical protein